MNYSLHQVAPHMVEDFWPLVKGFIKSAIEATENDDTVDHQEWKVRSGKAQLWIIAENVEVVAAGITEILITVKGAKILHCSCLGGKALSEWQGLWQTIETWAKAEGCSKIRLNGRPGWLKLLSGFRQPYVVLEKNL